MSRGLNYAASVSPAFNLMRAMGEGGGTLGALQGGGGGPLSNSFVQQVAQPTKYRSPTQVYERSIWGNQMRPATAEDRSGYNQQWLGDRRNVGGGEGQVDRSLAQAATESGNEGGK